MRLALKTLEGWWLWAVRLSCGVYQKQWLIHTALTLAVGLKPQTYQTGSVTLCSTHWPNSCVADQQLLLTLRELPTVPHPGDSTPLATAGPTLAAHVLRKKNGRKATLLGMMKKEKEEETLCLSSRHLGLRVLI